MDNNSNLLTYLEWRGDIPLEKSPFNEIDALVLAIFSYLNLDKYIPAGNKEVTVKEIAQKYFASSFTGLDASQYQELFRLMSEADRFKDARLSHFNTTLTDQCQFSALKIVLEDGTHYVAFRGTDDTLVGWREDFEISFKETKAQIMGAHYLKDLLNGDSAEYILGGHSKGGNLAEYAALKLPQEYRARIKAVYTFDSPGLASEVGVDCNEDFLKRVLHRYVPDFSIIGRLFEPKEVDASIVYSTNGNIAQHDTYSWQIKGNHFVTHKRPNSESRIYNQLINQWIGQASLEEREALTQDLFDALAASGSNKINQLAKNGFGGFGAILLSVTNSSRRTKLVLGNLFSSIWQLIKSQQIGASLFNRGSLTGWLLVLVGIISLTTPAYAFKAFGILVSIGGIIFSVKHILSVSISAFKPQQKHFFLITYLVLFAVSVALLSNNQLLIFLAHYFLGAFLLFYAYGRVRRIILRKQTGIFRIIVSAAEAIISFSLGIIVIINPEYFNQQSIIEIGILLIAYGAFKLIAELFSHRPKMPRKHR
ncbi:beta-carotene 15,15'-monooxygenase [Lactobacillus nasalidis]|uniref:Beta-carotene 15,15'-monooxygenase n=1 Tax=Lactobacillus nasalidis TaxID=2797258 RepID=A0ABQ3W2T3_9LACO|nr:Mbeg1-like protein [Lactobacillus nasalidis]GHV98119.1 beta-carotene 15,15'-monooxygenase [Lactobacillus nasalidis]GHV99315.1 beta-carotene 15,15'-monooxygenase [Lactobacillus nasalidis]GHW00633.1 beta-carotene 15,15'-monooxygenase [Lactobacillus nasalidis]